MGRLPKQCHPQGRITSDFYSSACGRKKSIVCTDYKRNPLLSYFTEFYDKISLVPRKKE